jgi:hypothetical protein
MFTRMLERPRSLLEVCRTSLRKYRGASDYRRWKGCSGLSADWDSRTEQIARLIPQRTSVLEFGAGRMVLRKFLPEGCTYTPSDLVDRGAGTLVCDLNARELPEFPPHDVAVFSGVLEYVNDVPHLVSHLSRRVGMIIASYAATDEHSVIKERRSSGWVNDYSSNGLQEVFSAAGFRLDQIATWRSQRIYRFIRGFRALEPSFVS